MGAAHEALTAAAVTGAVHILGDAAGSAGALVAGETAVTGTLGGLRLVEARFRQMQTAFTSRRVAWFAAFLRDNMLGSLHNQLQQGAEIAGSAEFEGVAHALNQLQSVAAE
jgi:hypothetical protein